MKIALCFVICGFLAGCSFSISGWEILAAEKYCESRGGVDSIQTFFNAARCRDGTYTLALFRRNENPHPD